MKIISATCQKKDQQISAKVIEKAEDIIVVSTPQKIIPIFLLILEMLFR